MADPDPKDPSASNPKPDPKDPPKDGAPKAAKTVEAWKPKVGGVCTAVFMRGGPLFVERQGKILTLAKDGTATVEYQNDRGKPARLEGVEYVERGSIYNRACYTAPLE